MKQFEKRFNQIFPLPPTIERGPIGRDFKVGCEKIWREALEWVKREAISLDERGDISRGVIDRELEN